ncbi:pilus assembly protein PilO [Sporosarcina cascadiensis]|uniref:pilus assembly protein PilO n=1 Tax=Sporosarcina cascadiensis TaxID=2660747 RepID=UPI00129BA179|nr:pilus assembly protein PilO [Sporosarcina cascadiensis]
MSKYFTKRQMEIGLVALASIFLIALVFYSVYTLYLPAKEQKDQAALQLSTERDTLFALQKQLANKDAEETFTSQPLQQKVPVIPLEDGLLLQIEKAEVKSGSQVTNVSFTKELTAIETMPEEVQNLQTVLMEVELLANTYEEVETFIYEVEETRRILNVETIQFKGTAEKTEENSEVGPMELVISFNAYFRPDLENLQNEAPKLDAPPAASKEDPTTINKMTGDEKTE